MRLQTTFWCGLLVIALACKPKSNNPVQGIHIPTIDEVGTVNLTQEIEPVIAPFPMPEFKRPLFPDLMIDIADRGATEDEMLTPILNTIIDEVSENGGGTVIIPKGKWTSGRIELKSNVNLHFADSAIVQFSGERGDYQPAVFTRIEGYEVMSLGACIYANGQNNIAITGNGKLIGPADGGIRSRIMEHDIIENVVDLSLPVKDRIYDGSQQDWLFAPMFISPINCTNVFIEGQSLEHTAFWNIVPIYCDTVMIRGITVNSVGIPRGDGIDVESSRNVLIEYCTLSSGDDCFTMKAGRGADGIRVNKPTENVVVRYCLAKEGHGGITCGSETAGMIRNLYVYDCVFEDTGVGIRFKTRRPRGGGGENLYYERIRMNTRYTVFKWDMLGSPNSVGELANRLPEREINELTPRYSNISAKNLIVENGDHFLKVIGIPESPLTNLTIENALVNCKQLIQIADVDGLTLTNLSITSDSTLIELNDAQNVTLDHVNFNTEKDIVIKREGEKSKNLRLIDSPL